MTRLDQARRAADGFFRSAGTLPWVRTVGVGVGPGGYVVKVGVASMAYAAHLPRSVLQIPVIVEEVGEILSLGEIDATLLQQIARAGAMTGGPLIQEKTTSIPRPAALQATPPPTRGTWPRAILIGAGLTLAALGVSSLMRQV